MCKKERSLMLLEEEEKKILFRAADALSCFNKFYVHVIWKSMVLDDYLIRIDSWLMLVELWWHTSFLSFFYCRCSEFILNFESRNNWLR